MKDLLKHEGIEINNVIQLLTSSNEVKEMDNDVSKFYDPMTQLFVKDVNVSQKFYKENFGFIETFRDKKEGVPDHVELKLGNFLLAVSSISAAENVHGIMVGTGLPKGELVILTDDVDKVYNKLLSKGVTGIQAPHVFRGTLRPSRIFDPDGNYINIVMNKRNKT